MHHMLEQLRAELSELIDGLLYDAHFCLEHRRGGVDIMATDWQERVLKADYLEREIAYLSAYAASRSLN